MFSILTHAARAASPSGAVPPRSHTHEARPKPIMRNAQKIWLRLRAFRLFCVPLHSLCACGGIGRRARLRIWLLTQCRFESCQAHNDKCQIAFYQLFGILLLKYWRHSGGILQLNHFLIRTQWIFSVGRICYFFLLLSF